MEAVVAAETIRLIIHRLAHQQVEEAVVGQAQDTAAATRTQDLAIMAPEAIHLHHALPQGLLDDHRMATIDHREGLRILTVLEDRPLLLAQ